MNYFILNLFHSYKFWSPNWL
ncbi:hypothetical protein Zm00014a_022790 [Zea mays]|uniref:Uncharacterized protein n=1 Tax=Zea mays TaxID=4577 RepID=A0A3L6ELL9_MAIZE|nr:hypothetical protein Zm00014a_022790 [Zea mays]